MIQAILCDLDGTLYPYDPSEALGYQRAQDYAVREMSLALGRFQSEYEKAYAQQRSDRTGNICYHSRTIRFQFLCENLGIPLHYAPRLADAYWKGFLEQMKPFDGVLDALALFRERGIRLGIGTNMTVERQFSKLEKLGLLDSFDFIVTSEEVGIEKPDPAFFRYCADKAKCPAGECLFIGDNIELDVRGALSAGLKALWFQPDPVRRAAEDVPSIASWRDVPELVRRGF